MLYPSEVRRKPLEAILAWLRQREAGGLGHSSRIHLSGIYRQPGHFVIQLLYPPSLYRDDGGRNGIGPWTGAYVRSPNSEFYKKSP